ncbi:MAG: hypothetical protein M3P00_02155 [Gemmatimonadota bacterium]|nr:hypothetical protein [Gemmatimonadota bacterium]
MGTGALSHLFQEAVLRQSLNGFTRGRPAHAEPTSDIQLHQARTWTQTTLHDQGPQLLINAQPATRPDWRYGDTGCIHY